MKQSLRQLLGTSGLLLISSHAYPANWMTNYFLQNLPWRSQSLSNVTDQQNLPWQFTFGGGLIYTPKYRGASHNQFLLMPSGGLVYKQKLFSNGQGIGAYLFRNKKLSLAFSLLPLSNDRSDTFRGLDDIKNTWQGGGFLNYTMSSFSFGFAAYRTIGHLKGSGYYQPSIGYYIPLGKRYSLNFAVSSQYDDKDYMQAFFGVNQGEATRSHLPAYSPSSGWENTSFFIVPTIRLNQYWNTGIILSARKLMGQAAKSPIVGKQTLYTIGITLNYAFGAKHAPLYNLLHHSQT